MPGTGGLSIANNLLANDAQLNLNRNQGLLQKSVQKLSSGLRINNAADDPSGLAIAEALQSQVNGFDQAARNVQDASNAATVAEGALQTTTDILQRIRTLAVEGASDVTSATDKSNLQAEVQQLLSEVNRISQNTNFNGQYLLNGDHAGFQQQVDVTANITANSVLANPTLSTANTLVSSTTFTATNTAIKDGTIEVQVAQISSTQQGVVVTFFDAASGSITNQAVLTVSAGVVGTGSYTVDNIQVNFNSGVGTLDVGSTTYIHASGYVSANSNANAPAFNFQSGALEGQTIQVGIQATNTAQLRISNVNLIATTSSIASEDAIGAIDHALDTLLSQRASLGATIVRLQEDQNNDNVAATNLQASESNIRDLNVAAESTAYTRQQILVQVGTSVLTQSNSNAQSVLGLFR